jgi:hypothetical protein
MCFIIIIITFCFICIFYSLMYLLYVWYTCTVIYAICKLLTLDNIYIILRSSSIHVHIAHRYFGNINLIAKSQRIQNYVLTLVTRYTRGGIMCLRGVSITCLPVIPVMLMTYTEISAVNTSLLRTNNWQETHPTSGISGGRVSPFISLICISYWFF